MLKSCNNSSGSWIPNGVLVLLRSCSSGYFTVLCCGWGSSLPFPPAGGTGSPGPPAFAQLRRRPCWASDAFGNLTHAGCWDDTSTKHFRAVRVQGFFCLTQVFPVASEIFWVLVFHSHLHLPQRTTFHFLNDSSNSGPFSSSDYTCLFLWGCGGSAKLKLNKYRQWVRGNTKVWGERKGNYERKGRWRGWKALLCLVFPLP